MALIEGGYSKIIADVDGPNANALRTVIRPRQSEGAYIASAFTGLMVSPVINSAVFAMRNGPGSDRTVYITDIYFAVINTSASTGASAVTWDLMLYSGTNFQQQGAMGGTSAPVYGIMNKRVPHGSIGHMHAFPAVAASHNSVVTPGGWAGGQISVCNTAGLTSGSVGRDTTGRCTILPFNTTTTTPTLNSVTDVSLQNASGLEHPIEIRPGTGVFIQNSAAVGTGVQMFAYTRVQWFEI